VLRGEIHDVLLRTDAETYGAIAGQVHDAEEEALADLLVDVNLAEITRDVAELRTIEAALERIGAGTYGMCIQCREPIDRMRLDAQPTAERCIECQRVHDRTTMGAPTPSL
jgi:RNA polymerase-binding transcription factor DksA